MPWGDGICLGSLRGGLLYLVSGQGFIRGVGVCCHGGMWEEGIGE